MANAPYILGREAYLKGTIAFNSDNIKLLGCSSSYTPNLSTDQFKSDISGGAIVFTSGNLASKTTTGGTADAADLTITAVSGSQITQLVMYKDTGTGSTSPLFLYLDTATNLPLTPNGGDIVVTWDNGSNKIFTLFEGLSESDRLSLWGELRAVFGRRFKAWRGDAELSPGGLWIPAPSLYLAS